MSDYVPKYVDPTIRYSLRQIEDALDWAVDQVVDDYCEEPEDATELMWQLTFRRVQDPTITLRGVIEAAWARPFSEVDGHWLDTLPHYLSEHYEHGGES